MKNFLSVCILLFSYTVSAQQGPEVMDYAEGSVLLNNGKKLKGLVRYDNKKGLLYYENGRESGTFIPRHVTSFSFFDDAQKQDRIFYSLEYKNIYTGLTRFHFFEVLKELNGFAVITKTDKMEIESNAYFNTVATLGFPLYNTNSVYKPAQYLKQDETLYILDRKGTIAPYLEVRYIYRHGKRCKKTKIVEKGLLPRYFGDDLAILKKYSRENNLSFSNKEDFIKIVGYYKDIAN